MREGKSRKNVPFKKDKKAEVVPGPNARSKIVLKSLDHSEKAGKGVTFAGGTGEKEPKDG